MSRRVPRGATVTEATVSRQLIRHLHTELPDALPLRHEDKFTKGVPDLSISLAGHTSFWELKYADPDIQSSKLQRYMCQQLDTRGFFCRYVIFRRGHAHHWPRQIRVVNPHDFAHWRTLGLVISSGAFDYRALVRYIQEIHERHHHSHAAQ
jgi:hypothetical protein